MEAANLILPIIPRSSCHRKRSPEKECIKKHWMRCERTCFNCFLNMNIKMETPWSHLRYEEDPTLGIWVSTQRKVYCKKELLECCIRCLNSIGFVWKLQTKVPWTDMFHRLVVYKEEHNGSTMVPRSYDKDPTLGHWVRRQRDNFRNKKLLKNWTTLLKSIDFVRMGWKGS